MSNFIIQYYYFLKDDSGLLENLVNILKRSGLDPAESIQPSTLLDSRGFYFNLADISGKMNILGIKTTNGEGGWARALELLQSWEKEAAVDAESVMGRLSILVDTDGRWPEELQAAANLVKCQAAACADVSENPLFRLPTAANDNEAFYVYSPQASSEAAPVLLGHRLPLIHGQVIFLHELDSVWLDRNYAISREKDELEKDLIRILHTKLVMHQPNRAISDDLERDIEVLATAYAKLVANKKLISDGIKRLESNLAAVEKQFLSEPALGMNADAVVQMMAAYHTRTEDLRQTSENLYLAEGKFQAAIEVVQSKIQVINSRINMDTQMQIKELLNVNTAMQRKSLVFQFAAGLIEFIILAYYSLNLWSHLTHTAAEIIPSWIQLIFLLLFSGNTVLLTHYLAEYVQGEKKVRNRLLLAGICLILIIALIMAGTYWALQQEAAISTH
ncbi:MAG: hypothetical protein VB084_09245 [Syntrophomonadaceae bacterium]|nr:hypothetical protein [Syntrophomonadaceae bacterium]